MGGRVKRVCEEFGENQTAGRSHVVLLGCALARMTENTTWGSRVMSWKKRVKISE